MSAGLIEHMVELVSSPNKTTVLIATKALAVVCRNSPKNQSLAIDQQLLTKCIELLGGDLDMYTAKWVILVMNALVYDNPAVRRSLLARSRLAAGATVVNRSAV